MGISKELYDKLRESFGMYSSWAVWADAEDGKPKSNIGDMSIFNDPNLLNKLNDRYIFVGLNAAEHEYEKESECQPWNAFHSSDNKRQQDYKLRYALMGTNYWGSYMTDILKEYKKTNSRDVEKYIKGLDNVFQDDKYIGGFIKELELFETPPTLIAMGNSVEKILKRYFSNYDIVKIQHYASWIGKEKYREKVLNQLKDR